MTAQPICSENELRCRSTDIVDCKSVSDTWNFNHKLTDDVDQLENETCFAELRHLQDVEPISCADNSDDKLHTSNKRGLR